MMPWFYKYRSDPKAYIVQDYVRGKMEEALKRSDKPYILLDNNGYRGEKPANYNILDYLKNDMNMTEELKNYKKIDKLEKCDDLEIWAE